MANDNPEKYMKDGGVHLERLTPEDAEAEGLDPKRVWIGFGLKEGDNVIATIVPGDLAVKIANAIVKLASMSL